MKLTAKLKLLPSPEQGIALTATLRTCNAACNWISQRAWHTRTFRQFDLHRLVYQPAREKFSLSAQVTVRCIAKVADAYKLDRDAVRTFRPVAAQAFDDRILSFKGDTVSIWTVAGRQKVRFTCGEQQLRLLAARKGEADLAFVRGSFYLLATCDAEGSAPTVPQDAVGIDLGIVNLAVDSGGRVYDGTAVEKKRRIYSHRRRNLQRNGSRSSKRKLNKIAGRQARYQRDVNHCISKSIVQTAERSGCVIAMEDLHGIRSRVKARSRQRARMANWGFAQLRAFVEYKARLRGIPVLLVDPRNTSRECPTCGHIDKANRPSRDAFKCLCCGVAGPADHIAARNIRARAYINRPMVAWTNQVPTSSLQACDFSRG